MVLKPGEGLGTFLDLNGLQKWGAFKVPIFALATLPFLVVSSAWNEPHARIVPLIVFYIIGASVISYCHSLIFSKYIASEAKKQSSNAHMPDADQQYADGRKLDLPWKVQTAMMIFHVVWFSFAFWRAFPYL